MIIILPRYNGSKKGLKYLLFEVGILVVSLVLMFLTMHSPNFITSSFFSQGSDVTLNLLKGYNLYYKILIGVIGFNITGLVVGCLLCLWKIISGKLAAVAAPIVYTILIVAFGVVLNAAVLFYGDVFSAMEQSAQDIRQVESDELSTMTVYLSKRVEESSMPGPYSSAIATPLMKYSAISAAGNNTAGWVNVYIPNELNAQVKSNEFYNDGQSMEKNEKTAQKFKIYYTENFKLTAKLERVS